MTASAPVIEEIEVDRIVMGERLRPIDEGYAHLLAKNIRDAGGLRQPIEIRSQRGRGDFALVAGGHRFRAVQILGWERVPAIVRQLDEIQARLAEIDENLIRHDLNPLDRAVFLAARKAVYEELHPETKRGEKGRQVIEKRQTVTMTVWSFGAETAARCGLSEETIRRAVRIAGCLSPEIRARVAGTAIARNQAELLALAKLPPERQGAALDLMAERGITKVSAAASVLGGRAAPRARDADRIAQRLFDQFARAPKKVRHAVFSLLRPDIEAWLREQGEQESRP